MSKAKKLSGEIFGAKKQVRKSTPKKANGSTPAELLSEQIFGKTTKRKKKIKNVKTKSKTSIRETAATQLSGEIFGVKAVKRKIEKKTKKPRKLKTKLNKSLRRTKNKFFKDITPILAGIDQTDTMTGSQKQKTIKVVTEMIMMLNYILENNLENEKYVQCIREKLRHIKKFLRRLEGVGYSFGAYLHYYGFDGVFITEDALMSDSLKPDVVLENMNDYLRSCDKYRLKDKVK